jgi:hypothetical protein
VQTQVIQRDPCYKCKQEGEPLPNNVCPSCNSNFYPEDLWGAQQKGHGVIVFAGGKYILEPPEGAKEKKAPRRKPRPYSDWRDASQKFSGLAEPMVHHPSIQSGAVVPGRAERGPARQPESEEGQPAGTIDRLLAEAVGPDLAARHGYGRLPAEEEQSESSVEEESWGGWTGAW